MEEAGGATAAQVDLNKKREAEINKLRRDLEEANIQHEGILVGLKKKHVDATSEMSEQVDQLNKMKQKVEKEKHAKKLQIDEIMAGLDVLANEKATECRPANQDVNVLEGGRPGIDVKDVAGAGSVGKLQPRILHPSNT